MDKNNRFEKVRRLNNLKSMSRHELTEKQWKTIEKYLPKPHNNRGRPMVDPRKTLNGIIYVLKTGLPGWTCLRNMDRISLVGEDTGSM